MILTLWVSDENAARSLNVCFCTWTLTESYGLPRRDQRDAGVDLPRDAPERAHHADVAGVDLREAEEHRREHEDAGGRADRDETLWPVGVALDVDAVGIRVAVEDQNDTNSHDEHPDDGEEYPEHWYSPNRWLSACACRHRMRTPIDSLLRRILGAARATGRRPARVRPVPLAARAVRPPAPRARVLQRSAHRGASHAFHFGIDISAPDGTPVYAVTPGKVFIEDHGHAVAVQAPTGRAFGYWHVTARGRAPPAGRPAPAARAHRGALGPRALRREHERSLPRPDPAGRAAPVRRRRPPDDRADHVPARGDRRRSPATSRGALQICCVAYDTTPHRRAAALAPHAGRARARALPHLLRGPVHRAAARRRRPARLPQAGRIPRRLSRPTRRRTTRTSPVATASSSRTTGTARRSRTTRYLLEVEAADIHGNRAVSSLPFTIRNGDVTTRLRVLRTARPRPARGGTRPSG